MTIRVAISGYGRIGRNILRAHYEGGKKHDIEIVAINDLGDPKTNAHLTRYDTAHGSSGTVEVDGDYMVVNGDKIRVLANRNPAELPWGELKVDVVLECTGFFTTKERPARTSRAAPRRSSSRPRRQGRRRHRRLRRQPRRAEGHRHRHLERVVHHQLPGPAGQASERQAGPGKRPDDHGPRLHQRPGLTDVYHEDLRRARSATMSMIPTKTGAAAAVGLVLPELNGKLDGYAIRVPTINVSIVDLSFVAKRDTTVEEVNSILKAASEGELKGILDYNTEPLVSVDYNHNPASSTVDASLTKVSGRLVRSRPGTTTSGASRTACSTPPSR